MAGALTLLLCASTVQAQTAAPQLVDQMRQLAPQLAPGQKPASDVLGGFGANRQGISFLVELQAGRCYTLVGIGDFNVRDLDMFLFSPANERVALDRRTSPQARILHCAAFAGNHRVELKVKRGEGNVAIQAFEPRDGAARKHPAPVRKAQSPPPRATAAGDPLGQQLEQLARASAPGLRLQGPLLRGFSRDGDGHDLYFQLDAGRCYTILTLAAPSIRRISTYLWEPVTNKRRATDRSKNTTSRMQHCTTIPGTYHFQAKSTDGDGEFRTGVYAAPAR